MAKDYKVREGDCVSSSAAAHGFFWETIWNDPKNAELKKRRGDPNVILPGDLVHIKDKVDGGRPAATEQTHRFVRRGVPAILRLRLVEAAAEPAPEVAQKTATVGPGMHREAAPTVISRQDEPRANVPYELRIGVSTRTGKTDPDGVLEELISPLVRSAVLVLFPGTAEEEVHPLSLGRIDPVESLRGVRDRLRNLGYPVDRGDEMTASLGVALRAFQEAQDLDVTGKADQDTREKLKELHGC